MGPGGPAAGVPPDHGDEPGAIPGGTEVRSWKVRTGSTELPSPVLFDVPGRVTSLATDRSGQHILAVTQPGDLYRWSRGDARPTKLAGGVTAAVWIPWS